MPTSTTGTWNSIRPGRKISPRRQCGGFTLLEMLVVMVIIAVMAGLALPALHVEEGPTDLARAALRVNGALNEARERTILTRKAHTLVFYADRVVLEPEHLTSMMPGSVRFRSVELEGDDDDDDKISEFPREVPLHPRGACAKAAVVLGDKSYMTLYIRPFILDAQERHGIYTLKQLTNSKS